MKQTGNSLLNITDFPLPHFGPRPPHCSISTVVVHSIWAPECREAPFNPSSCIELLDFHQVSAHYVIDREGSIWNLVRETERAWHAGLSKMPDEMGGEENVNDFSIGIELIGNDQAGFTELQYQNLAELILNQLRHHPLRYIIGHEHIALPKGRKTDPGPNFSWSKLHSLILSKEPQSGLIFPRNCGA